MEAEIEGAHRNQALGIGFLFISPLSHSLANPQTTVDVNRDGPVASSQLELQLLDIFSTRLAQAQGLQAAQLAKTDRQACHLAIGHVQQLQIAEVAKAEGKHSELLAAGEIQLSQVTQPSEAVW